MPQAGSKRLDRRGAAVAPPALRRRATRSRTSCVMRSRSRPARTTRDRAAGAARGARGGNRRASRGSAPSRPGGGGGARARSTGAPASTQARTTSSSCSRRSDRPGRIGATSTPHGMPASLIRATASIRLRGCGVPGSVARHTSSSSVPIEKHSSTRCARAASTRRSRSRSTSVPFVRIENGFPASPRTSMMPCVSRYFPSARWYGSCWSPSRCARRASGSGPTRRAASPPR